MNKIIIVLLSVYFLFGCISYNSTYMEARTTQERLIDVAVITIYGGIIGASVTYNLMEK